MTFQTLPVNIVGPSYQDRSRPLSSQETRCFYHEMAASGKEQFVIKSFPGQKNLGVAAQAGKDRGSHQMLEVAYRVVDQVLYELSRSGAHTNRGTIPGTSRCIFADDGINMFIVADKIVSQYSSSTQAVTTVTDPDITGALSVTFLNNQFIYTFPLLSVVSTAGDGSSATSINAIGAETNPDDLVRDYAFNQVLTRCGKRSIENWWNSGVGTPPIDRIEGQIVNIGLAATHAIGNTRDYIYWLGSDLQVYRARGGQEEAISTSAIAGEIQGYTTVSDAYIETFTLDNMLMVLLDFPAEGKTWCLNEMLGTNGWIELSVGTTPGSYNAGSIIEAYNKVLIGDKTNGNLNYLDFDTYDIAGATWQRRRVIGSINGDMLGIKGMRVKMSRMEFIMETGVGLPTGQGSAPQLMIEASYDGGRSWVSEGWLRVGYLGEYSIRAEWFKLVSFYDMIVRITTSDPVAINIYSAAIDLKAAGR